MVYGRSLTCKLIMTDFTLFDEKEGIAAGISPRGELYTAPIEYSIAYYVSIDAADTPFEIVQGKSGKRFVMTSMLLSSSKTFGTATAAETLHLYEAYTADLDIVVNTVTQIDLLKNDRLVATALNLATSDAISIVASATDTNVNVTIAGYYVNI